MALYSENNSDWGFRKNNEAINEVANSDDTYLPEEEAAAISEIPDNIYGKFISGTIKTINDKDTTMITEANAIRNQFDLESLTLPNCTDICRGMIYNCPNLKELNLPAVTSPSIINPLLVPRVFNRVSPQDNGHWDNSIIYDDTSTNNETTNKPMDLTVNFPGITTLDTLETNHDLFCQIGSKETKVKLNFPNLTDINLSRTDMYASGIFISTSQRIIHDVPDRGFYSLYIPKIDFGKNDIKFHGTGDSLYVFYTGDFSFWDEVCMEGVTSLGQTVEGYPYYFFYSCYDSVPIPGIHFPNCKDITGGKYTFCVVGEGFGGGCKYGKFESLEEINSSEYVFFTNYPTKTGFFDNLEMPKLKKIINSKYIYYGINANTLNFPELEEIDGYNIFNNCKATNAYLPKLKVFTGHLTSSDGENEDLDYNVTGRLFNGGTNLVNVDLRSLEKYSNLVQFSGGGLFSNGYEDYPNLTNINLNSLKEIAPNLINGSCPSLKELSLPNAMIMEEEGFAGNNGIEKLIIPRCGKFISNNIRYTPIKFFKGCTNLNELDMSKVTSIDYSADSSYDYSVEDEYEEEGTRKVYECASHNPFDDIGDKLEVLYLNSLTSMPEELLSNCTALKKLNISNCTTFETGDELENCTSLEEVFLSNVQEIVYPEDKNPFRNLTELKRLFLNNIKILDDTILSGCPNLEYLDISNCTELIDGCFANNPNIKEINLSGIKEIQDVNKYKALQDLENVEVIYLDSLSSIPSGFLSLMPSLEKVYLRKCENIQSGAFDNLSNLEQVYFTESKYLNCPSSYKPFENKSNLRLINLSSLVNPLPSELLFDWQSTITSIEIKVPKLGPGLFCDQTNFSNHNTNLVSLSLPLVTTLPQRTCRGCENLEVLNCPEVVALETEAIYGTNIEEINLPKCERMLTTLTGYGKNIFNNGSLTSISMPKLKSFSDKDYYEPHDEFNNNCGMAWNNTLQDLTLEKVKSIANYGFQRNFALKNISLPECTSVQEYGFSECCSLENINLPKCTYFGDHCFDNALKKTTDPRSQSDELLDLKFDSMINIGAYAFAKTERLKSIELPKCEVIGAHAFDYENVPDNKQNLEEIIAPNCTSIGDWAFLNARKLTSIQLPKLTQIGVLSFYRCGVEELHLPSLKIIPRNAFSDNIADPEGTLEVLDLPVCEEIRDWGCAALPGLVDLNIPKCTFLGYSALVRDTSLTTISLPNVVELNSTALYGCSSVTYLYAPKVERVGDIRDESIRTWAEGKNNYTQTFAFMTSITSINLPSCKSIHVGDFNGCSSLEYIYLPKVESMTNPDNKSFPAHNINMYLGSNTYIPYIGNFRGTIYVAPNLLNKYRNSEWGSAGVEVLPISNWPAN